MKKIILIIIVFFGIFPVLHHGHIRLVNVTNVRADDWGDEDGDGDDPPDDPPPCDDSGDTYSETPAGSDNCFSYTDWTDVSWDCDGTYEDSGTYSTPLTSLSSATVGLDSYSGEVDDAVTVYGGAETSGDPGVTYTYEEYDDDTGEWSTIASTTDASVVYIIDVPGDIKFRVTAVSDCGDTAVSSEATYTAVDAGTCGITGSPSLILSSTTGNLHDEVLLTAIAKRSGTPSSLTYDFQVLNNGTWLDQGASTDSTYSYSIDENDTKFRVVTTAVCGGVTTQDSSLTKEFIVSSPNVVLTTDETAGKPGDEVHLTATVSNASSLTNLQYTFEILFHGIWTQFDAQPGNTLTYDTKVLGQMQFRVQITYDGAPSDPVASSTVSYQGAFCADDFQTHYATDMNTAWTTTQNDANSNHGTLYEEGFLGTYNGSSYGTQSTPLVSNPCGTVFDVTNSSVTWPSGANPVTGDMPTPYILGKFHTHPPIRWCTSSVSYAQGPSCVDLGTCAPPGGTAIDPTTSPFPMVVRTYSGTVTGGSATAITAPTVDTAYGNTCTNY